MHYNIYIQTNVAIILESGILESTNLAVAAITGIKDAREIIVPPSKLIN